MGKTLANRKTKPALVGDQGKSAKMGFGSRCPTVTRRPYGCVEGWLVGSMLPRPPSGSVVTTGEQAAQKHPIDDGGTTENSPLDELAPRSHCAIQD